MKKLIILFFLFSLQNAIAQVRLPGVFSSHMVLQQQSEVDIWGWSGPSEKIAIKASWSEDTIKVQAISAAKWTAKLKTPAFGGPHTIRIKGNKTEVILTDVMIGEVWICSGQSNMEWSVNSGLLDPVEDYSKANIPSLRLFHVDRSTADYPQVRGEGTWEVCTPETMKRFSAAGFFFGKKLNSELNIPIGLINVSWGGTQAESWIPKEKIDADPELKAGAWMFKDAPWRPKEPNIVYNSMIAPLIPFGIAGVIWYQGESNTLNPAAYPKVLRTMLDAWRSDFKKEFPFYYVQIAPYSGYGRNNEGALLRESQTKFLSTPKTGMVIISDKVDNIADIHPKLKKPVGERLAGFALTEVYKHPVAGYRSPIYKSMKVEKGKAVISFDFAESGVISFGGDPKEFQIAGADKKFYPAMAKVVGNTVVVSAKEVKVPVAVRYAWGNAVVSNLYNKEGLPVSLFRTDDWEVDMSPVKK